jgi:hypothetical protein
MKGLKEHLEVAHGLKKKERQLYLEHYGAFQLAKPEDVTRPPANGHPFEALEEPICGFQCTTCSHISSKRKTMRGHCNKAHEWK